MSEWQKERKRRESIAKTQSSTHKHKTNGLRVRVTIETNQTVKPIHTAQTDSFTYSFNVSATGNNCESVRTALTVESG